LDGVFWLFVIQKTAAGCNNKIEWKQWFPECSRIPSWI